MPDFSELKPWIQRWGHEAARERLQERVNSDLEELKEFYNTVSPYLEGIIEHLNRFPIDEIPDNDRPLAWMALALCEVDDAIHVWKATNLDYISDPVKWRTKSAFTDYQ